MSNHRFAYIGGKKLNLVIVFGTILIISATALAVKVNPPSQIPEFTQTNESSWINSKPLTVNDLRGKVVLIDIWTYGCWNCYRSFPWLNNLEIKLAEQEFQVIGIHTPEFDHEKERENVIAKIKKFMLHHPVMMDNDFAYWHSLNNKYWPAYYIVDKQGKIRGAFVGETHEGDPRAIQIENLILKLLKEDAA